LEKRKPSKTLSINPKGLTTMKNIARKRKIKNNVIQFPERRKLQIIQIPAGYVSGYATYLGNMISVTAQGETATFFSYEVKVLSDEEIAVERKKYRKA
jgi:hypothetical protein